MSRVPDDLNSLFAEARSALRGVVAIAIGDRAAPRWFDLTGVGLVGSFIALTTALLVVAVLQLAISGGGVALNLLASLGIYAVAIAMTAAFLSLVGRRDALVPVLATQNWASAYLNLLLVLVALVGGLAPMVIVLLIGVVISVNILRLIGALKAGQIVGFFAFQFALLFAFATLYVMTLSPEDLARLNSQLG